MAFFYPSKNSSIFSEFHYEFRIIFEVSSVHKYIFNVEKEDIFLVKKNFQLYFL